eukprot:184776_1
MVVPKSSVLTAFDQQTHEPKIRGHRNPRTPDLTPEPKSEDTESKTEGTTKPLEQSVSSDVPVASDLDSNLQHPGSTTVLPASITANHKPTASNLKPLGM